MTRNKWAKRLGKYIQSVESFDNPEVANFIAIGYFEKMRLDALEPFERKIYNWIVECEIPMTSHELAVSFNIKLNHAGTVLKALYEYGLLSRKKVQDTHGLHFIYTVKGTE